MESISKGIRMMSFFNNFLNKIASLFRRKPVSVSESLSELEPDSVKKTDISQTEKENLQKLQTELESLKKELGKKDAALIKAKKETVGLDSKLQTVEAQYSETIKNEDELKRKNDEIEKDLDTSTKAITFVTEILNAEEAKSRDVVAIREKTDKVVNFVQSRLCETLEDTTDIPKTDLEKFKIDIERWKNLQLKTWLQGKTVIAFVGEFSAGKTSIVNRILTGDKKGELFTLPVDNTPTTAIATYIYYGSETQVQFTDTDGRLKEISRESFMQFSKESIEKFKLARLVQNFIITYDNESLNNLSVLDTPGFSSNDEEDERRTAEVVREADALFWVIDVNAGGINNTSVNIIQKYLKGLPLYIVINKADVKSPAERSKVREKIKQTLEEKNIHARGYIEFSKKEPLENLTQIISLITHRQDDSNIITHLTNVIEERIEQLQQKRWEESKRAVDERNKIIEQEDIVEKLKIDLESLKKRFSNSAEGMRENTKQGWFGSEKIKNPDNFWQLSAKQTEAFNAIIKIIPEYTDACNKIIKHEDEKYKFEKNSNDLDRKVKTLVEMLKDFNKFKI